MGPPTTKVSANAHHATLQAARDYLQWLSDEPAALPVGPVEEWTVADVERWLERDRLAGLDLGSEADGAMLLDWARRMNRGTTFIGELVQSAAAMPQLRRLAGRIEALRGLVADEDLFAENAETCDAAADAQAIAELDRLRNREIVALKALLATI